MRKLKKCKKSFNKKTGYVLKFWYAVGQNDITYEILIIMVVIRILYKKRKIKVKTVNLEYMPHFYMENKTKILKISIVLFFK